VGRFVGRGGYQKIKEISSTEHLVVCEDRHESENEVEQGSLLGVDGVYGLAVLHLLQHLFLVLLESIPLRLVAFSRTSRSETSSSFTNHLIFQSRRCAT
jgi:hypothetical protein